MCAQEKEGVAVIMMVWKSYAEGFGSRGSSSSGGGGACSHARGKFRYEVRRKVMGCLGRGDMHRFGGGWR